MTLEIVILAAGKGTRMRSALPKVMHAIGGAPLLGHVITTARAMNAAAIHIVYGHGGEMVRQHFADAPVTWILQEPQLGTGHAVAQALGGVRPDALVLVMYGDVPLVQAATLLTLADAARDADLALLTAELPDASGYGRVLRDTEGRVVRIVEHKDASGTEREVNEINTGFLCARCAPLAGWLSQLRRDNAQGEYYLTDVISMAVAEGGRIADRRAEKPAELLGVNSKGELARLERLFQQRQAERLLDAGVTLRDPARIDVRGEWVMGVDCELDVNVILEGDVRIGDRVRVGPNTVLRNTTLESDVIIEANCVLDGVLVGPGCVIGPFARLRPETRLEQDVRVGNFVEVKKSSLARGTKANHLSYIGDSTIGRNVNIGAGVITCNYDGANKHRTIIDDGAFIGSDSQLIAPVHVGEGATIAAGSTVTRDAAPDALTVSRAPQKTIRGWRRPRKSEGE